MKVPSNIKKRFFPTLVFDNTGWKSKKGKKTQNTNSILIQETPNKFSFTKIDLNPYYNFEKGVHSSFKPFEMQLEPVRLKRGPCKDLRCT